MIGSGMVTTSQRNVRLLEEQLIELNKIPKILENAQKHWKKNKWDQDQQTIINQYLLRINTLLGKVSGHSADRTITNVGNLIATYQAQLDGEAAKVFPFAKFQLISSEIRDLTNDIRGQLGLPLENPTPPQLSRKRANPEDATEQTRNKQSRAAQNPRVQTNILNFLNLTTARAEGLRSPVEGDSVITPEPNKMAKK